MWSVASCGSAMRGRRPVGQRRDCVYYDRVCVTSVSTAAVAMTPVWTVKCEA